MRGKTKKSFCWQVGEEQTYARRLSKPTRRIGKNVFLYVSSFAFI